MGQVCSVPIDMNCIGDCGAIPQMQPMQMPNQWVNPRQNNSMHQLQLDQVLCLLYLSCLTK